MRCFSLLMVILGLTGCYTTQLPAIELPATPAPTQGTKNPAATILLPTAAAKPALPGYTAMPAAPSTVSNTRLITRGSRTRPYIALTFDACQSQDQSAGYDAAVIDILTSTKTPATLFLGGLWMQRHPGQTRILATNPLFELGNHSWSHADFTTLSKTEMSHEIKHTQLLMTTLTGQKATLFRFPAGSYTAEALAVVGEHGLHAIQWDVVSGDPDPAVSTGNIVAEITRKSQNGSIVIMHMNGWGWHTAKALPAVIRQLRERGYRLVTVSQLLAHAQNNNALINNKKN